MRKTKNCIEPWRSVQFEARGSIIPCCSGTIAGDFGNVNKDYFDKLETGKPTDIFINIDYRRLRRALLTGDLPKACKTCRSVHDEDVPTEELRRRVVNYLQGMGIETDGRDLTSLYAFEECGGNITNKCNFSCIYCAHSGKDGHTGALAQEMDRHRFLALLDFLCQRGLKIFNFCGIGELTIYPDWVSLCEEILKRHAHLRLRCVSNFGKRLCESELDILARFDLIHISCDTFDEATFAWLRKGGRLPTLIDNIQRLKDKLSGDPEKDPKLAFNVTVTDAIVDKLEDLFRFAADNDIFVHFSSLFVMEGSIASKTNCVKKLADMDMELMPHVRDVLYNLPRRLKAQNPMSGVWEYKHTYNMIMQKADQVNKNTFVPEDPNTVYGLYYKTCHNNSDAYLRRFWLSFDEAMEGIYVKAGKSARIPMPSRHGRLVYRVVWCRERIDGDCDLMPGPLQEIAVTSELTVSAKHCENRYAGMLFDVKSYKASDNVNDMLECVESVSPIPSATYDGPILVREAFLADKETDVVKCLVDSQEPIVIWCAGLKTVQMFSTTCLRQANIKMIVDRDPSRKGEYFCGYTIKTPDEIGDFQGKIVVIHASCPERVASGIRDMGISNEIVIL